MNIDFELAAGRVFFTNFFEILYITEVKKRNENTY